MKAKGIEGRKAEHIEICAKGGVSQTYRYWDDIKLIHEALPEVDYDEIDTTASVLGARLDFPFIVNAITGGYAGAKKINENIAIACSEMNIGMGIGSQRAAAEGGEKESYRIVKEYDIPLVIGNIGAPQLIRQNGKRALSHKEIDNAMEMIDADYMAVHLNYLQECIQPEGDTKSYGCFNAIRDLAKDYPIIVKETGAGMSESTVKRLGTIGVRAIDIGGMGGTSFSAIEMKRAEMRGDPIRAGMGLTFFDWGIPAPVSLITAGDDVPIISSGGIMSGLDVAKSIVLGAVCAGASALILEKAMKSADETIEALVQVREELKTAMMLTGCSNIDELRNADCMVTGRSREWLEGLK